MVKIYLSDKKTMIYCEPIARLLNILLSENEIKYLRLAG
jgi:hypothetical protein